MITVIKDAGGVGGLLMFQFSSYLTNFFPCAKKF